MKTLTVNNTKLSFESFSLHIDQIAFQSGNITGIIGPNGSGKSTLLKIISGITPSDSGTINYADIDLTKEPLNNISKLIAYVGPTADQQTDMTVFDVVATGRYPHSGGLGFLSDNDTEMVESALTQTGLTHLKSHSLQSLSSGELQRVFIARAITQDTPIIVLDEPVANVDPKYTLIISNILKEIKQNKIIIIVLHDMNLAMNLSDHIVGLKSGKLVLESTPVDIDETALSSLYDVLFSKQVVGGQPFFTFLRN